MCSVAAGLAGEPYVYTVAVPYSPGLCTFSFLLLTFRCAHIFILTFNRQNVKRPTSRSTAQHMGSATCGGQCDMWCATCGGQRNMWWAVRHVVGSATCGGQCDMWWAAQHVVGSATPSAQHPQQTLSFSHSLSHGHSLSVWNTPGQGQASSKPRPPSKCLVGVLSRPSQLRVAMGRRVAVGRRVGWWRVAIG